MMVNVKKFQVVLEFTDKGQYFVETPAFVDAEILIKLLRFVADDIEKEFKNGVDKHGKKNN